MLSFTGGRNLSAIKISGSPLRRRSGVSNPVTGQAIWEEIMAIRKMLLASVAVACAALPITAHADTSGKKIALSNNYAGNSWRQAMLTSWDKITKEAVSGGIVAAGCPDPEPDPSGI
jgi:hypothetical protein